MSETVKAALRESMREATPGIVLGLWSIWWPPATWILCAIVLYRIVKLIRDERQARRDIAEAQLAWLEEFRADLRRRFPELDLDGEDDRV